MRAPVAERSDAGETPDLEFADDRRERVVAAAAVVLKTLGSVSVTLLGLFALTFFIGRVLPIDPVIAVIGDNAGQGAYAKVEAQLGLDKPLLTQFWIYVTNMVQGDFGRAIETGNFVVDDLRRAFPATIELATFALIIGTGLGIPMGVYAAVHRDTWIDQTIRVVSLVGYSAPNFWLGLMGLVIFYAGLAWVAGPGRLDIMAQLAYDAGPRPTGLILVDSALNREWGVFRDAFSHIVLPASVLGYAALAYIARMTRSFMVDQLAQEYIVAARIKGVPERQIVCRHAFRNIRVQLITVVVLSYAFLLEGAVLTETVFGWPGFGAYLTKGLLKADMNVVLACVFIVGLIFITLNLVTDVLYRVLDPRTR
jgi:peptide/nickel transport system permease protein